MSKDPVTAFVDYEGAGAEGLARDQPWVVVTVHERGWYSKQQLPGPVTRVIAAPRGHRSPANNPLESPDGGTAAIAKVRDATANDPVALCQVLAGVAITAQLMLAASGAGAAVAGVSLVLMLRPRPWTRR